MSDFRIIFVHGYTASSKADWYPNISPMLDRLQINYVIPDLPGGEHPHSKDWLKMINNEIKKTDKQIVFVGHSLGTRAVLLYLDQFKKQVETVVLIAPLSNETKNTQRRGGETYPDFFKYKIDLSKVKPLAKKWLILHSRDDDSLDYQEHGVALSKELRVKLITYEDRSHFSAPENAPYILRVLRKGIGF